MGVGFGAAGGGVPGGGGKAKPGGFTVTVTLAALEFACASLTTSEKASVTTGCPAAIDGAVKVVLAVVADERTTDGPDDCVQENEMASPSGSKLPLPSRMASAPVATARSMPAFAMGGELGGGPGFTVMVTMEARELAFASLTVSEKTKGVASVPKGTTGAVKLGAAAAASERRTAGPEVCVQAKLKARPAGSELALPSSVTLAPAARAWSGPALATGAGEAAVAGEAAGLEGSGAA